MAFDDVRPGEFRVCPACGARNKGRERACRSCRASLESAAPVLAASTAPWSLGAGSLPRRVRALIGVGVVAAILTGLYVARTFRATLDVPAEVRADDTVAVRMPPAPAVEAVPNQELTWGAPARGTDAPIVAGGAFGAGPALVAPEASLEGVAMAPAPEAAAVSDNGMMSITPSETRRRVLGDPNRTFTNDDLVRLRASDAMGAPPAPAPSAAPSVQ